MQILHLFLNTETCTFLSLANLQTKTKLMNIILNFFKHGYRHNLIQFAPFNFFFKQ